MKKLAFLLTIILSSCSSGDTDRTKDQFKDTFVQVSPPDTIPALPPDTASCPSAGYKRFVKEAEDKGFKSKDTAIFLKSGQKEFFGLANVGNTFSAMELGILANTKNACLRLEKKVSGKPVQFDVEEWTFDGQSQAELVEHALTAPLVNKTDIRFISAPFTFWRVNKRIYYVHTVEEKARNEMNALNDLLVNCVSMGGTQPN